MHKLDYTHIQLAELYAQHSKANRAKVGAVMVTSSGVLIPGYNGTPRGTNNTCEDDAGNTKFEVIHAELNCILKAAREGISVVGSKVYVTLSPCRACAAMLLQAGVGSVYYRKAYRDPSGIDYLKENGMKVEQL